ncbi:CLUMA_CG017057, isoform A [Clunio marinus]|uniref:CLUMA_CG017057, isoform A n=1 Tax=Clunio marinus TaxID=568069 RepID=A0A1J1IV00_9DIPT|nr:CLUMA_CG017057, isoform A [Clunio marinus]
MTHVSDRKTSKRNSFPTYVLGLGFEIYFSMRFLRSPTFQHAGHVPQSREGKMNVIFLSQKQILKKTTRRMLLKNIKTLQDDEN